MYTKGSTDIGSLNSYTKPTKQMTPLTWGWKSEGLCPGLSAHRLVWIWGSMWGGYPRKRHHPSGSSKRWVYLLVPESPVLPRCSKDPQWEEYDPMSCPSLQGWVAAMTIPAVPAICLVSSRFESSSSMKPSPNLSDQFCLSCLCSLGALKQPLCGSQSEFSGELLNVQTDWVRFSGGEAQRSVSRKRLVVLEAHSSGRETALAYKPLKSRALCVPQCT